MSLLQAEEELHSMIQKERLSKTAKQSRVLGAVYMTLKTLKSDKFSLRFGLAFRWSLFSKVCVFTENANF